MRRILVALAALTAAIMAVAVVWSYFARAAGTDAGVTILLAAGTVIGLAATAWGAAVERRPGDLVVPEEFHEQTQGGTVLPAWSWWRAAGPIGLADLIGGAFASRVFAVIGAVLLAAAIVDLWRELARPEQVLDRHAVIAARDIRRFADRHGDDPLEGALEFLGQRGARLVVVAADGAFGDVVLRDPARARVAAELAGVQIVEAEAREFGARLVTAAPEWERMAGIQLNHNAP